MDDDFNTPAAIANLHAIFKYANGILKAVKKDNRQKTANTLKAILDEVKDAYKVIGFFTQEPEKFISELKIKYLNKLGIEENEEEEIPEEIKQLIEERKEAKKNKDYETADKIRSELDEKGIILNDTVNGTVWDVKALY